MFHENLMKHAFFIFTVEESGKVQSTPDNSNLLRKSKKVRVIGISKQITGSTGTTWAEERTQVSCIKLGARDTDWYFQSGIKQQSFMNIQGWALNLKTGVTKR